jgi:hypothetical protein
VKLKPEDLPRIIEMIPAAYSITAEKDGIRIEASVESGDETIIGQAMRAALRLQLDPSQIVDQTEHVEAYSYSTLTSGGGYTTFNVKFLYEPI